MQVEAGIRELKAQLSAYLRRVKGGETVIITERGKPVGRIIPYTHSTEAQLETLKTAGLIAWNGQKLPSRAPVAHSQGKQTVADLLLEDRD